ncbi:Hypothetical predicted protein [Lecanosticta acicola]|uniref:Uncharacterized protein n=1 Tax=Lecanosticta acicola TaxID=111012 RepID=A0AAI8Z4Q4_9PEZI|nr:Hypothetical predicted protein [Lecanosticta acicola]
MPRSHANRRKGRKEKEEREALAQQALAEQALASGSALPEPPPVSDDSVGEMADSTSQDAAQWRQKYDDQVQKNADDYEENIAQQSQIDELVKQLEEVKRSLKEEQRLRRAAEKQESGVREAREKRDEDVASITESHASEKRWRIQLQNQLKEAQQSLADAQSFADNLQRQVGDTKWDAQQSREAVEEKDALLAGANERQAELEEELRKAQEQAAEDQRAVSLMDAIIDTLEAEFEALGKELTPSELHDYLEGLLTKSHMARNASEVSMDDAAFSSRPLPKSRDGMRSSSLHDELDQLDETNFEREGKASAVEYDSKMTMTDEEEPPKYADSQTMTDIQRDQIIITTHQPTTTVIQQGPGQTVYVERGFWASMPLPLKIFLTFLTLLLITHTIGASYERRMWIEANTITTSTIDYYSQPGLLGLLSNQLLGSGFRYSAFAPYG